MPRTRREEAALRRAAGSIIDHRRRVVGLSVTALAERARVDMSQLVKVLKGECGLSLHSRNRLALALDCEPGDLLPPLVRSRSRCSPSQVSKGS